MPKAKGKHLTWTDRLTIEKMLREGYSKPQIARYLGVHHSTIYDECKRGLVEGLLDSEYRRYDAYSPEAGRDYHKRAVKNMDKELKIGKDHALANWLVEMISSGYSPAAACSLLGKTPETTFSCTLCRQTVYKYIEKGDLWPLTNKKLRYKGTRKRKYNRVRSAAKAPRGDSIEQRPEDILERLTPGDWEMDSVLSGRKGRAALLVLTERVTRFEIGMRVPDHTAASVVSALDRLERRFGARKFRKVFKSITVDNGTEFSDCEGLERSCLRREQRTKLYYCHPYSSWERGSNEKQNQMIRWHFPKGTNFGKVSQTSIDRTMDWINNYPRKILGWRTSEEMFKEFLASL